MLHLTVKGEARDRPNEREARSIKRRSSCRRSINIWWLWLLLYRKTRWWGYQSWYLYVMKNVNLDLACFESSALSNSSGEDYLNSFCPNEKRADPRTMLNISTCETEGILIIMNNAEGFSNFTIFDKHTHSWLSKKATGYTLTPD